MPIKTDPPSRNRWQKNWGYLVLLPLLLVAIAVTASATKAAIPVGSVAGATGNSATMVTGQSSRNDVSPPLRDMKQLPMVSRPEQELNRNPYTAIQRKDEPDKTVQNTFGVLAMPTPILNFDGIPFPGVSCNCAPPDTNGEAGATQYVQMVNEGYEVFNKNTGASILGPSSIVSLWAGFGGVCQTDGHGDPVVLYDQLANRWLISQFAGAGGVPTDECIAVSTTNDATGSYNRYDFHLGSNFFDYPHLGVWPDAYYMSDNVFNAAGTIFLGPQPFAFDRNAMLAGAPATFVTTAAALGATVDPFLPADLDGSNLPTSGAPASFVGFPGAGQYTTYHFHVDFGTPANSTWTTFAAPPAAGFTQLCPSTRACVPELGGEALDGIGDRPMFRLAYRKFGDGHESVVGNYSVSAGGVSGVRWFELRGVTAGPVTVFQESTYQPDATWRWMGSIAMDQQGNMALGYSASSTSINPQIRYSGRLVSDPLNQMAQGEATLFAGTGSQTSTGNRWGDYSDMTVDPVDDCTFWYTQEYYAITASFNWRTRIGSFKFPGCSAATPTPTVTGTPPTNTPTVTPTATSCSLGSPINEGFEGGLGTFSSVVGTCVPGGCGWTPAGNPHTGSGSAFAPDLANISDQYLQLTNSISIPASTSNATLTFWHAYDMESTYDGGVLEVSTDGGGTWADVTAVGGIFNAGAYNGTISSSFGSPISGRQAWTGAFTTYSQVSVNLNSLIGQANVKLRFREANDNSVAHVGWNVDDVLLTLSGVCVTGTATNTPTNTALVPTSTATNTPTNTAVVPTHTATNTPTNTAVVPTHTATNTPTNTAVVPTSTATNTPTNTAVVPTNTPTSTPTGTVCAITTPINEGFEGGLGTFSSVVATCVPGGCGWVPSNDVHTGTGAAFAPDPNNISDQSLQLTSAISIPAGSTSATLTFWHHYDMESGFDGGVLEVSTDGGSTWADVLVAGGSFISGGYTGTISTCCSNPLQTRQAWTGVVGAYSQVSVNLNSLIGQPSVKIRFREGTDSSVSHVGWFIDDVLLSVGGSCATATPTIPSTPTASNTPTRTATPTIPATPTASNTPTRTATPTIPSTPTASNTPSPTATVCSTNAITNGGFETGSLAPWVVLGTNPAPVVSTALPHTGTYSALLGSLSGTEPLGDSSIYQTITVPAGGGTLSYWYNPSTVDSITFDWQDAYVTDTSGNILATIMHICSNSQAWTNQTFDMTPFAGQTVRIEFLVHQDGFGDDTSMYVDDVSLGSACGSITATPSNTPTNTAVVPTNTPSNTPTNTAVVPTNTPSNTPTNTAIVPTNTPSNTPTNTAEVPTNTPSNTPTDTPIPTATVCGISNLIDEGFEGGLGAFNSVVGTCVPGGCGWVPAGNPHSGSGSAFAPDLADVSDQYLELTNSISIPGGSGSATLTFWHAYDMEPTFDGGVLEVSTNGGSTWVDVLDAGGSFISGGYDDTISTAFNSPIAGRQAWTGVFTTYRQVEVNLNSLIGQNNVKLRFREANDDSVAHVGWNVDDVVLAVSDACGSVTATYTTTPTPTPVFTITPTNTPVPLTNTPTNTPSVTPTDTSIVPTDTPTNTPTGTRSPTDTPTNTPVVPPSSTSTGTGTPSATSTVCSLMFTDVPVGSTFYPFIRCLACRGIINGYTSGCETGNPCFRPENNVSRGQLSKIVSNSAGWTEDHTEQTYEDVAPGSTFHLYIERLSSRGIINGYPCGGPGEPCGPGNRPYFRPNGSATRGQIAKIDVLAAVAALGWTLLDPATNTFEDVPVGSTFFRHIETAYAHGVLNGYPCGVPPAGPCQPGNKPYFVPNNLATRGQTSKIVANTFFPSCDTP